MTEKVDAIVCGAGIAGISAAYFLSQLGLHDIVLVDERPPLTLTSDRSTECYRNWWPDPAMRMLMDRSIDLMEQLARSNGNMFHLNRRGYLYVTGDAVGLAAFQQQAQRISDSGAGALRVHAAAASAYKPAAAAGFEDQPTGADLLVRRAAIQAAFPYITADAVAALHVRRAGWMSAQQLGMFLLDRARQAGVRLMSGRVTAVDTTGGRVSGAELEGGRRLDSDTFVNAGGPFFRDVGALMGLQLPVEAEIHLKVAFEDSLHIVDRAAPLLVWNDPQLVAWTESECRMFESNPDLAWLNDELPGGAHTRPEGNRDGATLLMLWDYRSQVIEPTFPVPLDDQYPELVLRGLSRMLPALQSYIGRAARPRLDGGYYVRTRENRPIIGATPLQGGFLLGALSGFGIMAACGAGELLAKTIVQQDLPGFASAFGLARYDDMQYVKGLASWTSAGEL